MIKGGIAFVIDSIIVAIVFLILSVILAILWFPVRPI